MTSTLVSGFPLPESMCTALEDIPKALERIQNDWNLGRGLNLWHSGSVSATVAVLVCLGSLHWYTGIKEKVESHQYTSVRSSP